MLEQLGRALWTNGETEAALEAHEEAVAIMPADPPTPARARVLSGYGQILMLLDRWSESTGTVRAGRRDGARGRGAPGRGPRAQHARARSRGDRATAPGSVAPLEEAIAIAREVANADDIGRGYVNLGEAKRYCGDIRGAVETVREGVAVADEVGVNRTYGTFIRANGVAYALRARRMGRGRPAGRRRASRPSRRVARSGATACRAGSPLLVAQGDERAAPMLDELRSLLDGFPVETQFHNPFRIAVAEAALWRGDPEAALASVAAGTPRDRGP